MDVKAVLRTYDHSRKIWWVFKKCICINKIRWDLPYRKCYSLKCLDQLFVCSFKTNVISTKSTLFKIYTIWQKDKFVKFFKTEVYTHMLNLTLMKPIPQLIDSMLYISTSFQVLQAPESWLNYCFFQPFSTFFVHFKLFSVISRQKSTKNVWKLTKNCFFHLAYS